MARTRAQVAAETAAVLAGCWLAWALGWVFAHRVRYPFDLEWMEGGMLAHAWRLAHGLPLYDPPSADFAPFIYPPGYPAVVAGLGAVFGLSMPLGRAVSAVGILAAAAAIAYAVRRAGGSGVVTAGAALVFLGTYPQAGAFYDIVRPDALGLGLTAWSVALVLDGGGVRRSAVAGILLAAAFAMKHNLAAVGLPLALALAVRDRRAAAAFVAASVGPALAEILVLEVATSGRFLVWLLEVPATHALLWTRAWVETPREWGTALPIAWGLGGGVVVYGVVARITRPGTAPAARWAAAAVPTVPGILTAWAFTYEPPQPDLAVAPAAYGTAYFALVAVPLALVVAGIDGVVARVRGIEVLGPRPAWNEAAALALVVTCVGLAGIMRVHDGGWVNVHAPLFLAMAFAFGLGLVRLAAVPGGGKTAAATFLAVQIGWAATRIDRYALVPKASDVYAGMAFVEAMRKVDGPVLSPFSAWTPVYAGKAPSIHAMAVWDCNYPDGPFRDDLAALQRALREQRWSLVLAGSLPLVTDLTEHYEPIATVTEADSRVFWPRTGYMARPWRILAPREEER